MIVTKEQIVHVPVVCSVKGQSGSSKDGVGNGNRRDCRIVGGRMSIRKYPIKKEFYPFAFFATPTSKTMIKLIRPLMKLIGKPPKDPEVERKVIHVPGYDHGEVEIVVFTPKDVESPAPCLVNYHGGGFMFEPFTTHYKLAIQYAKKTKCKVFFVNYRLVLDQPMPYPQEDYPTSYH